MNRILYSMLLVGLSAVTGWSQPLLHTLDFSIEKAKLNGSNVITAPIEFGQYRYLQIFKPSRATVKLTNVPTSFSALTNPKGYSVTPTGTDLTVNFPSNKFRRHYLNRSPLLLVGLDDGGKGYIIQYVRAGDRSGLPSTGIVGELGNTIVELDMCPDAGRPLQIYANGVPRKWLYVKTKESVTFRARNVNPNSFSVAINGDFHNLLVESGGEAIITKALQTTADPGAAGAGVAEPADQASFTIKSDAAKVGDIKATISNLKDRKEKFEAAMRLLDSRFRQACLPESFTPRSFTAEIKDLLGGQSIPDSKHDIMVMLSDLEQFLAPGGLPAAHPQYAAFKSDLDKLTQFFSDAYFDSINDRVDNIKSALQNRLVASLPITVNGRNSDVVRFTVEKQGGGTTKSATYDVFIVGGVKIDVSAGFFVSNLVDHEYVGREVSPVSTTGTSTTSTSSTATAPTRYMPVKETKDRVSFAPGALIHAYPRLNLLQGNLNFGISAGLSTGARVNYYAGLSALLGRQQRIVLSAGLAWGKVKRLSDLYADNDPKGYAVTGGQFVTRDVVKRKCFIGFTYNLGSNNPKPAND